MGATQWAVFLIIAFTILIFVYIDSTRKTKVKMHKMLLDGWGKVPKKEYSNEEYDNISHYFRNDEDASGVIDDITWNDLDMDRVFKMMNNTHSSVGQEYLYKMLRMPRTSGKELTEFNRLSKYFDMNEEKRLKVQKEFVKLGYAKHISVTDYINLIIDLKPSSNILHVFIDLLLIATLLGCVLINAQVGLIAVIAAVGVSIITYYRAKAEVEHYFICVKHIVKMVITAEKLEKFNIPELSEYNVALKKLVKSFDKIVHNSSMLSSGSNVNGSLGDIILDYVRMLTHIDLIKFNNMIHLLNKRRDDVYELITILGTIESSIAIASFRTMLPYWSEPELAISTQHKVMANELYHPLIENPVVNSISENRSVLLTGSNASGKSTFLKTVAINAILSQTIYTSVSKQYRAPYFRIYSSMSLRDDLGNNESYYIVEIKALKRILDVITNSSVPVLCFVDEVLRGTNTVERIAASSQILKSLSDKNVMCFAATHDIELTYILEKYYANYHFREDISKNDVIFNYQLFKGRATSRNAIKLLGIIGYGNDIIKASENAASQFMEDGVWKPEN